MLNWCGKLNHLALREILFSKLIQHTFCWHAPISIFSPCFWMFNRSSPDISNQGWGREDNGTVKVLSCFWSRGSGSLMLRVARNDKIIVRIAQKNFFIFKRLCTRKSIETKKEDEERKIPAHKKFFILTSRGKLHRRRNLMFRFMAEFQLWCF